MTHDDATHIDLSDALRNLRQVREGLIEQIRAHELDYADVKTAHREWERRFDAAVQKSTTLTEALQQNTLSIWRIEWKLARSQGTNQITDLRNAQDAS